MRHYMHAVVGCTAIAALGMIGCTIEDDFTEDDLDTQRGLGIQYPLCRPQAFNVNPRRSLFETHQKALNPFTMVGALSAIAGNSGLLVDPLTTHDFLFDTYNPGPGLPGSPQHCDDQVSFLGGPGLNNFPLECPRAEGGRIGQIYDWFPIAAVNRFDLAPADGADCGEARLVFANQQPRVFVIFEAKIPNPYPDCGINACAPVQHFWAALTNLNNPTDRAHELRKAYLDGHPFLMANGFQPFLNADAFKAGAGQLRTNNFNQGPWTLREFKAVDNNPVGELRFIEVPVAANPYGEIFNDTAPVPGGAACRAALVANVANIVTNNVNLMGVNVPSACLAAESPDDFVQQYPSQLGLGTPAFDAALAAQAAFLGNPLTGAEVARRVQFAGGCIGCHEQTNFQPLGAGVFAPNSLRFVHTDEQLPFENCGDGQINCFVISDALKNDFLPFRKQVMDNFLNGTPCCDMQYDREPPQSIAAPDIDTRDLDGEAILALEAELDAQHPITISGAPSSRAH